MTVPSSDCLWSERFERDSCGFGLIAHLKGEASHRLVSIAIEALVRLTHRGAVAADGRTGDWIRVTSADSRRELVGRITANGVVDVE